MKGVTEGMSKTYYGRRLEPDSGTSSEIVVIVQNNGKRRPLHHWEKHSPNGFSWGYGGSGPADLALAILADAFRERPTRSAASAFRKRDLRCLQLYQDFKWQFVARWGDEWEITEREIEQWAARFQEKADA